MPFSPGNIMEVIPPSQSIIQTRPAAAPALRNRAKFHTVGEPSGVRERRRGGGIGRRKGLKIPRPVRGVRVRFPSPAPLALYPQRIYNPRMANNKTGAPLTPAVLHILLALSTAERHGYGIMKQVEADSQGKVNMGPGTLYGSLGRMIDAGLVRESDRKIDPEMDDERRIYYRSRGSGGKRWRRSWSDTARS